MEMKRLSTWMKFQVPLYTWLVAGDIIDKVLYEHILEGGASYEDEMLPDLCQALESVNVWNGTEYYPTVNRLESGYYIYLGILPAFEQ